MNIAHEQCPKTVTQNSALNQNWVKCTVCTPIDPGCAHAARALQPGRPCRTVLWRVLASYSGHASGRVVACG